MFVNFSCLLYEKLKLERNFKLTKEHHCANGRKTKQPQQTFMLNEEEKKASTTTEHIF